jgi:hypothetical protein
MSVHFVNMTTTGQMTAGSLIINGLLNGTSAYYSTIANCDIVAYYFSPTLLSITVPLPATTLLPISTLRYFSTALRLISAPWPITLESLLMQQQQQHMNL